MAARKCCRSARLSSISVQVINFQVTAVLERRCLLPRVCLWWSASNPIFHQMSRSELTNSLGHAPGPRDDVATLPVTLSAVEVGEHAPRFLDQQRPRRDVPWREVKLEETVEHAGGDHSQVERGRARAPHGAGEEKDLLEKLEIEINPLAIPKRESGRHERSLDAFPVGDANARAVTKRAGAPRRGVQLIAQWVPDDPGNELGAFARSHGNAPERKPGDEVGGAVERIDDPRPRRAGFSRTTAFLAQERVVRKALPDLRHDARLAFTICRRHEIVFLLLRDRTARQPAPIGEQDLASRPRRSDGDVDQLFPAHRLALSRASRANASAMVFSAGVPRRLYPRSPGRAGRPSENTFHQ